MGYCPVQEPKVAFALRAVHFALSYPLINGLASFCWGSSLCWVPQVSGKVAKSEQGRPLLAAGNKILPANLPERSLSLCWGSSGSGWQAQVSLLTTCSRAGEAFSKKLEDMSNQVLQWQKQHQCDLKMLAAKRGAAQGIQEEMCALKENLLADEKRWVPLIPITSSPRTSIVHPQEHPRTTDGMTGLGGAGRECLGTRKGHLPHSVPKQGLGVPATACCLSHDHLP